MITFLELTLSASCSNAPALEHIIGRSCVAQIYYILQNLEKNIYETEHSHAGA